jgi:hypothetical protein
MWAIKTKTNKQLIFENTKTGEQCAASFVWKHNELGTFYCVDNLLQLPYQRKYAFDLAQQMEKIGIEKDELAAKMEVIKTLCKEKKPGFELDVYSIASTVEQYVKDGWDYQKTAMLVTAVCIIQEDDSIGYFDQSKAMDNINKWKQDPAMLSFFLSCVSEKCSHLNNSYTNFTQIFSKNQSH